MPHCYNLVKQSQAYGINVGLLLFVIKHPQQLLIEIPSNSFINLTQTFSSVCMLRAQALCHFQFLFFRRPVIPLSDSDLIKPANHILEK